MAERSFQRHALTALAAAALFGAGVPLSKLLLGELEPLLLAGLLYLGSGLGLALAGLARAAISPESSRRSGLRLAELPWLAGAVMCGGIAAPVLLLWGLAGLDAASASLLLNAEAVFTTLLAWVIFHEHVGRRVWLATVVTLGAGGLLAWEPGASVPVSLRAAAVLGACVLWGLDNNLTRRVAGGDALLIAMVKGLAAGGVNLALALATGAHWPAASLAGAALLLGALSYGTSLVLYVVALRHLGSARTGVHFSAAPFFGTLLALALGAPLGPTLMLALPLMALGSWLAMSEQHRHLHHHEALRHTHAHVHDEHHRHAHAGNEGAEPHVHEHLHEPLTHTHAHAPDLHHRHSH